MSKKGKKTSPYSLQSEQAKIGASDITLGLEKFGNERDAQHLFLEGSKGGLLFKQTYFESSSVDDLEGATIANFNCWRLCVPNFGYSDKCVP